METWCERKPRSVFWTLHTFNMSSSCHAYQVRVKFRLHPSMLQDVNASFNYVPLCESPTQSPQTWSRRHSTRSGFSWNKVGYKSPKMCHKTTDTCLVCTVTDTGSVLHKKGAGYTVVSDENVKSICEKISVQSTYVDWSCRTGVANATFNIASSVTKTFACICLQAMCDEGNYTKIVEPVINLQWLRLKN